MNVAILHDDPGYIGGAELTMREFAAAAPEGVTISELAEADRIIVGNCVQLDPDIIPFLRGKPVFRYHNDLARHEHPEVREWLTRNATHIFTSPLHQERYGIDGEWPNIPPALNLDWLEPTRQVKRNGNRQGACSVGAWQNPHKGQQLLKEWADANEPVAVYGEGPFVPHGPKLEVKGPVSYEQLPNVLWAHERFVHLPTAVEPFGRAVVEAWAAGLDLVVNRLVGARYWLEEEPEKLKSAAEDFWEVVMQ